VLKSAPAVPYASAPPYPSGMLGFLSPRAPEPDAGGRTAMNPLNSILGTIVAGFVLAFIIAAVL